jgi:hypothetical protein
MATMYWSATGSDIAMTLPQLGHGPPFDVREWNPEAGSHAIPQDPHEIALALRAGATTWARFPYLEARFGARGRRFNDSDSCWLTTVSEAPAETALRSLQWLRGVLAMRGLPTCILDTHLRDLGRALATELPDSPARAARASRFDEFLAVLEDERDAILPAPAVTALVSHFGPVLRDCPGFTVEGSAPLVASAWLDEHGAVPGALGATLPWFRDPQRFSAPWIASIDALVTALGSAARSPC